MFVRVANDRSYFGGIVGFISVIFAVLLVITVVLLTGSTDRVDYTRDGDNNPRTVLLRFRLGQALIALTISAGLLVIYSMFRNDVPSIQLLLIILLLPAAVALWIFIEGLGYTQEAYENRLQVLVVHYVLAGIMFLVLLTVAPLLAVVLLVAYAIFVLVNLKRWKRHIVDTSFRP